jgi:hypothetical protein
MVLVVQIKQEEGEERQFRNFLQIKTSKKRICAQSLGNRPRV